MRIDPRTLEQVEVDLEAARGEFAAGLLSPTVREEAKLLAAAIAQAGAQIALAIAITAEAAAAGSG
jgi:hypothetical protein